MAARKFYAIAVGRRPGIYENWPQAQAQVHGYPGAVFKGFASREEAAAWLNRPHCRGQGTATRQSGLSAAKPPADKPTGHPVPAAIPETEGITIYTDGGARFNPGPGGYGIIRLYDGVREEISGGFRLTTNNRMELMGCIVALRGLSPRDKPVTLHTDSSYVVNGINKGWAKGWRKKGWRKADHTPAINPDLWAELLDLVEGLDISFRWVRGHAGNPLNERCDELAVAAARQNDLPEDEGYQGG